MSPPTYDGVDLADLATKVGAAKWVREHAESALAATAECTSSTYVDLLTVAVTLVAGDALLVDFTASFSNNAGLIGDVTYFELSINGAAWRSVAQLSPIGGLPASVAISGRALIAAGGLVVGANTVKVRWRRTGLSKSTIAPATEGHHAALRVVRLQA